MMISQRRAARELFFQELDRLDNLDQDEAVEEGSERFAEPQNRHSVADKINRRRRRSKTTVPSSLPPTSTARDLTTASEIQNAPPLSHRPSKPLALERSRSDPAASGRVKKAGLKDKKKKPLPPVPADRQLFAKLGFYFVPNYASPYVRALRIDFAIAHGATWVREWNESITHILVEPGLPFQEVAKALPGKSLPKGIPILSDEWVSECYMWKTLLDVRQRRFLVKGMTFPFGVEAEEGTKYATISERSGRARKATTYETPSKMTLKTANC